MKEWKRTNERHESLFYFGEKDRGERSRNPRDGKYPYKMIAIVEGTGNRAKWSVELSDTRRLVGQSYGYLGAEVHSGHAKVLCKAEGIAANMDDALVCAESVVSAFTLVACSAYLSRIPESYVTR